MQNELDVVRGECSIAHERMVEMGCVNFELENQLKDVKEKLKNAEARAQKAEEKLVEQSRILEARNAQQQEKYKSVETEFVRKV